MNRKKVTNLKQVYQKLFKKLVFDGQHFTRQTQKEVYEGKNFKEMLIDNATKLQIFIGKKHIIRLKQK